MTISFYGPPPPRKIVHRAKLISPDGDVSPLCAKTHRRINLAKASWTIVDRFVTCQKCKLCLWHGQKRKVIGANSGQN